MLTLFPTTDFRNTAIICPTRTSVSKLPGRYFRDPISLVATARAHTPYTARRYFGEIFTRTQLERIRKVSSRHSPAGATRVVCDTSRNVERFLSQVRTDDQPRRSCNRRGRFPQTRTRTQMNMIFESARWRLARRNGAVSVVLSCRERTDRRGS